MNPTLRFCFAAVAISTLSAQGTLLRSGEWSQWRGPLRTGASTSTIVWPESIGEDHLTKVWEAPLAEGYSGPVVAGGKLVTFATLNEKSEVVRTFDLRTGEAGWQATWEGAMKVPFFAAKNGSWVRSTPAVADGAVFVGGIRDVLVKLDAASGAELWRVDFMEREGTELPAFGFASSPLPDGGAIYIQAGCAVAKLDAATGKTLWRAMEDRRAMFGSAFSSPVIATLKGKRQLVAQTRSALGGLDPETGKELWSIPVESFRGMNILSPTIVGDDRIFTATYGGGAYLFRIDEAAGGAQTVTQVWRNEQPEGYMASPILVGEHIYLPGRDKRLHCLELTTGKAVWSTEETFGEYWSMVCQGDRILALDEKGELILFQASPEAFKLLDRRKISGDPTWAHLGIEGDLVMVRSLKGITVYQWR
jgi:outer membrane protein assembly factor BamB